VPTDLQKLETVFMEKETYPNLDRLPIDSDHHEAIRRRAEEIYVRSGKILGRDIENWVLAETELLEEEARHSHRAVVVKVNGVRYVGEYPVDEARGYTPGEFAAGDPVNVRFDGDQMFVRLNSGGELQTTIVRRIG
jgi:Protein of unknown function (DUF2934)